MTKSKKQFTPTKTQNPTEEFNRSVELAFGDHAWPANRAELLEHASRQGTFAKSDLARLKRIPQRDYHSIKDLMSATREADMAMAQPGPVASAEQNRRAMGEAPEPVRTHSADRYDEPIH
jgi:hypothetical protein